MGTQSQHLQLKVDPSSPSPSRLRSNFLFSGQHSSSPPPGSNSMSSSLLLPLSTPPPTSNQFYIIVPLPWPPGSVRLGLCSHSETWPDVVDVTMPLHSSPSKSSEHRTDQLKEQFLKFTLWLKKSHCLLTILPIYYGRKKTKQNKTPRSWIRGQPSLTPTNPWASSFCSLHSLRCSRKCPHWHSLHFWASCLLCHHLSKVVLLGLPALSLCDHFGEAPWQSARRENSCLMCHSLHSS